MALAVDAADISGLRHEFRQLKAERLKIVAQGDANKDQTIAS
jgi:hypothetical protein